MSRRSSRNTQNGAGAGAASINRLPNTTVCLPIVYGSIAFFLGKKASEEATHKWTLYVRGPNHEDLSVAISKVVFHLHPSFAKPVREITSPPFEVTEKGWGEFEATIRIIYKDPNERATVFTHFIKLYPPLPPPANSNENNSSGALNNNNSSNSNSNNNGGDLTNTKEPVIHEFYDEVVFTNPVESFYKELSRWSNLSKVHTHEDDLMEHFPLYSDEHEFNTLLAAQRFLEQELLKVKDRILRADSEMSNTPDAPPVLAPPTLIASNTNNNNNTVTAAAAATSSSSPVNSSSSYQTKTTKTTSSKKGANSKNSSSSGTSKKGSVSRNSSTASAQSNKKSKTSNNQ